MFLAVLVIFASMWLGRELLLVLVRRTVCMKWGRSFVSYIGWKVVYKGFYEKKTNSASLTSNHYK
jgi:hypothetical protein